jgi:type I restriction enzyme S subunit
MGNKKPNNWVEVSLGEIISTKKGKKPKSTIPEKSEGFVPYILIHEMEGGNVRAYTNDLKVPVANESDVLLVWDGSIGKCKSGIEGAIGSTLVAITPKGDMPTRFIEYFLKSKNDYIHETSTGTGLQHINKKFFKDCKIDLPPLLEQHRIVIKLDNIFGHLDFLKSRLNNIPEIIKKLRQTILNQAFSGELTEGLRKKKNLPTWERTSLGLITNLITSGSRGWAQYYSNKGAIFVRAQNINKDFLDLSDVAFVKLPNKSEGVRSRVFEKDLLITITGANVTKTALVDFYIEEAYVSQHVGLVRLNNPDLAPFVYLFLVSESFGRKQLINFAYGQGKPQLNLTNIKNVELDIPSLVEQTEIVKRVEHLFAKADAIEAQYQNLKAKIDSLPQAILAKAFKGELVEQLNTDGDAKVLLEEIQRLKASLKPAKKTVKIKKK